jgi:nucleoid-associated protein YgaU
LLWLVALWLAIGLAATLIAASTGRRHGLLATLSRRATPALLRRLVIASTGASIALSPVTAVAIGTAAAPAANGSVAIGIPTDPVTPELTPPGWPLDQPVGGSRSTTGPIAGATAISTGSIPADATPRPPVVGTTPEPPVVGTTPGPPLDPAPDRPAPSSVLVKPGDSLWLLTAQRLGPTATDDQIVVAWPYWYRQNRSVIGRDPNLLQPGQRLVVPTAEGKA